MEATTKKTQAELLEEYNKLMQELKQIDKEHKHCKDLLQLVNMAIDCQKKGKTGFYIPPALAYLKDELYEIIEFGEQIIPLQDNPHGVVS